MESKEFITAEIEIGVVGLGLMGSSIVVALLLAGHPVRAIAPIAADMLHASTCIHDQLADCAASGLLKGSVDSHMLRLTLSEDYTELQHCVLVLECVVEVIEIKEHVYKKIVDVVSATTIIASNTSAIPISQLQNSIDHPERFLGIHWAEPAFVTRFLEITCGSKTTRQYADRIFALAHYWGKEPTLLRKDIRGFITNRLMYAVYRESFHLLDKGYSTMEDIDKAFRYDAGSWMTLMGIFRRMDFTGLQDCATVFSAIFPELCNSDEVPPLMQEMIHKSARGTHNRTGLYNYTEEEAKEWEAAFAVFNKEIYALASYYPLASLEKRYQEISAVI